MNVHIRPLRLSDQMSLPVLLAQASQNIACDFADLAVELEEGRHWFPCVACAEDGRIVGYAELHRIFTAARGWIARLEYLVVDESMRRCGVGERLCRHLVARARELGCARLELRTKNPVARRMYEKIGFEESDGSHVLLLSL